MNNSEVVIFVKSEIWRDAAVSLSERTKIPISQCIGNDVTLCYDDNGICLIGYGMTYRGDYSEIIRRTEKGRLAHEMLVRAAKTKIPKTTVLDATAGMGEDSFLLAAAGYSVTMYENNPVIAALLKDTVRRALISPLTKEIAERMNVIEGDSIFDTEGTPSADIVYLDPMFPERKKSGLIGKKLQLMQKFISPCENESDLFDAAVLRNPVKIIVKRPFKGPYLAGRKPTYSLNGKAIRYDCYAL